MAYRELSAKRITIQVVDGGSVIGKTAANTNNAEVAAEQHRDSGSSVEISTSESTVASSVRRGSPFSIEAYLENGWLNRTTIDTIEAYYDRATHLCTRMKVSIAKTFTTCLPTRRVEGILPNAEVYFQEDNLQLPQLPAARSLVIDATVNPELTLEKIEERINVVTDNITLKLFFESSSLTAMSRVHEFCRLDVSRLAIHVGFNDVNEHHKRHNIWRNMLVGDIVQLYQVVADGIKTAPSEFRFFRFTFLWNHHHSREGKQHIVAKLQKLNLHCIVVKNDRMDYRFRMKIENSGHVQLEIVLKSLENQYMVV